jgi:Ca2+-transporting ATPase
MADTRDLEAALPGRRSSVVKGKTFSIRNVTGAIAPKPEPVNPEKIARTRTIALQHAARNIEDFTHVEWKSVVTDLASNAEKGLTSEEAAKRLERHGPNELTKEPPTPFWKLFLEQFTDLLVILLIIACIVSLSLQEFEAGSFILVIVFINAILGSSIEYSASDSLEQLEKMSADKATVIRDGLQVDVPSSSLVPGDIVVLINGCKCPADVRLIASEELSSEEAPLTGESVEVKKDSEHVDQYDNDSKEEEGEKALSAKNMCFMACSITSGHGKGVVVKTGMET